MATTAHVGLSPETGLLPGIPGKRCAHCNTQTTPLWRNGPDGAKTLCNACGVRDNRRHAKTRGPARPRPRKPEPGVAATTARLKKAAAAAAAAAELGEDAVNGGRRSARWNAGLLTKRAKAESLDDAARRARKRQRGGFHGAALHDEPGADVGADGTIFTPTSVDVADYDAGNDGTFVPSASYVSARPRGAVGRFAPGGAAPLYDATAADKAWLSQTNAGRPAHEHLRERQLEHLFDVFEEASWHSGSVPGDAAEAYDVLGYGGASVAEAEAAVKAGEMFVDFAAEEDLLSPAGAHVGLGHEGLEWDAVEPLKRSKPADAHTELKHENGSDRSYTPPLTPSGSVELATFVRAESASASVEGFGASAGSPGGSVPSRSADDTDVDDDHEDGSDVGDGSVFGSDASGNGKSSDLAARATVTSSGRATRAAARGAGAGAGLLQVNKETSELSERLTDGDETRQKKRGRRTNQKAASGAKGAAGVFKKKKNEAGGGGGGRGATTVAPADSRAARRATRAARVAPVAIGARNPSGRARVVPTMRDAELAFGRYLALRAENGGSALLARFARPAPPQLRARALLGGAAAGAGDAEDEAEAASVMAAAAAGEYQFVLGFEGVQRQQRERAARGEAIKEASRRRRRRACFNPAASKRRRKQQAAMEIAIEAPLQIVHDASPFAFGQLDQLPIDAEPAPAPEPDPLPEPEPAVHSEWESDDDLPLAALAGREESPDLTLADIAAQTARMEAEARRRARAARKAAAAKRAPLEPSTAQPPHGVDSVMAKVASAASCVLSRFIGHAKPADAFPVDSPSTPRKRRTPRARRVKTEA